MVLRRWSASNPCSICSGHPGLAKGQGIRCAGFLSDNGEWAGCTREQFAGALSLNEKAEPPAYLHRLVGDCRCDVRHDQSPSATRPGNKAAREEPLGPIVAEYDYLDADGGLVYQVTRHEPKTFRQRHPCPDKGGAWTDTLGGNPKYCSCPKIDRLLYGLPELLAADPSETVYVTEGEKDRNRLRDSGLVATCNSGGAGQWEDRYAVRLQNRCVVILPHNDKAGYDHGQQVALSVYDKAKSNRVLDLPGLGSTYDVSDWLNQGGTVEELRRLAGIADEWEPNNPDSSNRGTRTLNFRTAADIAASTPVDTEYIAKPWIASGSMVELDGKIKQGGKTTFVMAMCRKVLDGQPFMGEPTIKTPVVYLTEQNDASLRAALARADLLAREDFHVLAYKDTFGTNWRQVVEAAAQKCKETGAKFMVVDTVPQWAGLQGTSENDTGAALEALAPLQAVAAYGIGIVGIRHDGKADRAVGDSGRGSSAWGGGVDTIISIRRPEGTSSPTVRVLHCIGRFDELPDKWVIELDPETGEYRAIGTQTQQAMIDAVEAIRANSPRSEDEAVKTSDLLEAADVKRTTGQQAINELLVQGALRVVGEGKKNDPKRYWIPDLGIHSAEPPGSSGGTDSETTEQAAPEKANDGRKSFLPPLSNVVAAERNFQTRPRGRAIIDDDHEEDGDKAEIHSAATPSTIAAEFNFDDSVEV